jgi:TP901 family phage tail tape measure protein
MASAFNLTAQINLQGPANLKPVVAQIKRSLSGINTNINLNVDARAARGIDNLTSRINVLNRALAEAARNGQTLNASLGSLSGTINQLGNISRVNNNIARTSQSITSTAQAVAGATTEIQEFGKQSALAVRRFAAFSVVTSGIFSLINAINSGAKAFIVFDQQIVKLKQTTGSGSVAIRDLESEITSLSINLGVSSEKLAQVAIVLAQAGLSANQTKQALSALAKTELTPSFEDIMQTTEGAIAAMRQFNIESGDLEKALGSINAVAAAFAVESGDIVAAIQRAGGAFAASSRGVSEGTEALNEFIAVFTSVRATTRESAETVATGLRTIFTRIQRGSTIDFLREFNVELTDLDGKFVGPYEAVRRLSEVLNTLDPRDLRFSQIVEELGGFRQIGKVIPLIQQFSTAQEALVIAQRGQGSLVQSQVTAQQALANQLAKVREEFLALIRAVGQSQTFNVLFKSVLGLTSGLIKLAGVFKPILPLLAILGAVKGGSALTQYAGGFLGGLKKTTTGGNDTTSSVLNTNNTTTPDRTVATERANAVILENTSSIRTLTTSIQSLIQSINNRATGTTGFARGGIVPGSGNRDTVPAMLTPGEFVVRKKAVQAIGSSSLHQMNRYAQGGSVERSSNANDPLLSWQESKDLELAHIGDVSPLKPKQLASYLQRPSSSQKNTSGPARSVKFDRQLDFMGISDSQYSQLSNSDLQNIIEKLNLSQAEPLLVSLPKATNQSLRNKSTGVIKNSLSQWMSSNPSALLSGSRRNVDRISVSKLQTGFTADDFSNLLSNHVSKISKNIIYDSDINSVKSSLGNVLNQQTLSNLGSRSDLIWQNIIPPMLGERRRTQERQEGTQRLFDGGLIQKFAVGGGVKELAQSKGLSIEEVILQQVKELGDIKGVKSILGVSAGDRTLDSVLRASNVKAGKNIPQATEYVDKAIDAARKSGLAQSRAIAAATKVAIVGLQPLDKSEIDGPLDIGGKNVVIYIRGLAKQFADAVNKMREGIGGTIRGFAENVQSQAIFGGEKPLRLDFDETLVSGADIYDKNGKIDIAGYSDPNRVQDSLKKGTLTPLGQKVKELLALDPSFSDRISVLTARPQNNADLLSKRLNELGLPIPSSKITGTSGGGTAKAAALKDTERLIDDNLENVRVARSQNKSAIQYEPIRDLSSQEQAATGFASIEGSVLEATLAALGARGGIIQNRAVDFENGLGPAAQYFPGIGPDWPTEVKRTLDPNSIGRAKEEFGRFFSENAQRFAQGGSAKRYSWKENKGIMDSFNSTRSKYDVFEHSDEGGAKVVYSGSFDDTFKFLQQKRSEQEIKKMAVGGSVQDTVPALLTPGEFVVNKKAAKKIGSAKLNRLNKADKIQGFNKGGAVGSIQKFADGGFVESQEYARALRLMVEQMRLGSSAMVAARDAAKSIEFSLPEAARFLNEAADNFASTGDITSFGANDSSKTLLSDTFDSSGLDATASIEALAAATQRSSDVLSLFAEEAKQSGVSLQKFQANLKEQLANRALDIQGQRKSTRVDLRRQILRGKTSDLSNDEVVSSLRQSLTSQLTTLSGPSADPNEILASVDQLIVGLSDTSQTFDDLKNSSTLLTQAFDISRDRSDALASAQEEFSDQLGGLTDAVKVTIDELNALDYQKSGQAAADFGFVGNSRPTQALAFKNSSLGGGLLNTAKSFQESAFLDKLPIIGKSLGSLGTALEGLPGPIGSAVKAIGGLPGALAAVTSIIGGEAIPQLAKALKMADNETLAGVGGALSQGGSMGVSLGTLGNQLAGPIGGMIGVIGGSVAGLIKGFSDGFRTKALENSLSRLTVQTEKVSKAFEYLSKVDNAENVANAQKEIVKLDESMADFKQKSGRSLGERGADAGYYGTLAGSAALIGGLALTVAGGVLATAATAAAPGTVGATLPIAGIGAGMTSAGLGLIAGSGAIAAGGATYGALKAPDELDDEALQALLKTAETFIDGLNKLAERRIRLKSIEDLSASIDDYQGVNKQIDTNLDAGRITRAQAQTQKTENNIRLGRNSTAIKEAQRGALLNAGVDANSADGVQIMEREAIMVAEAAAMAELKRQYGENNALIRKQMMGEEALIQRGFELLGIQEYQANLSARLAIVTKQVMKETESLIDIYVKALAGIQAFSSDLINNQIAMEQGVGVLTGNASMGRVDRRNEEVLRNPRGYDDASFNKALESVAALAGGGQEATKLTSAIRGRKALEENLPRLLRDTTSKDVDKFGTELTAVLANSGVDPDTARELVNEVTRVVGQETEGRQGKSWEELSRDIPALQELVQSAEKAQQVGVALEEAKNNALEQVNKNLDQFGSLMQKSAEWNRKATDILLQGALELDKVLGKGLSLDRLAEPFNAEIQSLTAASNGGVGTMDPVTIAENIRKARAEEQRIRNQIGTLNGTEVDANGNSQLEGLKLAQEEVGRASRDAYAALEKLATSGANAANVLSKIEERRQIGKNAASFLEKVFTQTGEEAFNMSKGFEAFQSALKGNLNFGNQKERQMAFEGMNTLLPMLTGPTANKVQAAMLEQMLKGNNVNLDRTLIPEIGGGAAGGGQDAMSYRDIINLLRNPEADPATKALIETYNKLIAQQTAAAVELANLNRDAAKNITLVEIKTILNSLVTTLPQIFATAAGNQPQVAGAPAPNNGGLIPAVPQQRIGLPANNAQPQAGQPAQINGPANNNPQAQNNNQPLLGANNLGNINLPALDQIAIAIPQLDTQLLNVVNAFGILDNNLVSLKDVITNLAKTMETGTNNNTGFGQQLNTFGVSVTTFGTSVSSFGVSIKSFTSYVERLEQIKFPEKITMGGSYTLDVRVSGAAAFEALETKTKQIIDTEIGNKLDELQMKIAKATGFAFDPTRRTP